MAVMVDADQLREIGARINAAADLVVKACTGRAPHLTPDRGQCPGWSAVGAVAESAKAWGSFLATLGAAVSGLGDDLISAADRYARADAAAENRNLDRLGRGLGGPDRGRGDLDTRRPR